MNLRETLADIEHARWAGWMKYLFSRCHSAAVMYIQAGTPDAIIPGTWVDRWRRQINTPYADLSEKEKDSDRKEVDKTLRALSDGLGVVREALALYRSMVMGGEAESDQSEELFQRALLVLDSARPGHDWKELRDGSAMCRRCDERIMEGDPREGECPPVSGQA